jgi:hypothetical protein
MFRKYGPGKFNVLIDEYLYEVVLDTSWLEDECSYGEGDGWWGLIVNDADNLLNEVARLSKEAGEDLTDEEREYLSPNKYVGYIISEDSQGFVDVNAYSDKETLMSKWEGLKEEVEGQQEEEDESEVASE